MGKLKDAATVRDNVDQEFQIKIKNFKLPSRNEVKIKKIVFYLVTEQFWI